MLEKRVFDIIFSLFAIILLTPIMIIIAILIKVNSPEGTVFFRQRRLGLYGEEFKVLKFRTMVPDAEKLLQKLLLNPKIKEEYFTYRKLKNDVRIITGIGQFLRKSSLDELPQFFNVLLGTMSVVGPRPYMKAEFYQYQDDTIDEITSVKPGITGYWQVIPSRHDTTFDKRVESDLEYISNRSLLLDIKIIFKTVWVMGLRRGA
jgi:lipopolysaccharide/colanic/teichoic acid biosynthesis glycosyltransferase